MIEIANWKYHARKLQTEAILHNTEQVLEAEIQVNAGYFRVLDTFLTTGPAYLPVVFKHYQQKKDEYYNQAAKATKITAKRNRILTVLSNLSNMCNGEFKGMVYVDLDLAEAMIPPAFGSVFREYQELLDHSVVEGRDEARSTLLSLLQGETPLLRLRRDLATQSLLLSESLNKGLVGFVPTIIPQVDLRYYYARQENFPELSLVVKPF